MFPVKEVLAASVTLVVAWIGYRQWIRGRRSGSFLQDREVAYKAVWTALEEAHLLVRAFRPSAELTSAVQNANALVIRHALHLRPPDRPIVETYVRALRELADAVATADWSAVEEAEFHLTLESAPLPTTMMAPYRRFTDARADVMHAFREALGSTAIQ